MTDKSRQNDGSGAVIRREIIEKALQASNRNQSRNSYDLTEGQEIFAHVIADNPKMRTVEAYRVAFPNAGESTVHAAACRLMKSEKVQNRIQTIRAAIIAACPLGRGEALSMIADCARRHYEAEETDEMLKCIREMKGLIPEWQTEGENEANRVPDAIKIEIVTDQRERPVRVLPEVEITVQNSTSEAIT